MKRAAGLAAMNSSNRSPARRVHSILIVDTCKAWPTSKPLMGIDSEDISSSVESNYFYLQRSY